MKKIALCMVMAVATLLASHCSSKDNPTPEPDVNQGQKNDTVPTVTPKQDTVASEVFAYGADVSWVTEMEDDGMVFRDEDGNETDLFQLLSGVGVNAIRLRVWVNPEIAAETNVVGGGYGAAYCDKADVVAKAKRAASAGMEVMIDFHYSDIFADPSRQVTPSAWSEYDLSGLKSAVASHTTEVLNALKSAGVTPKWIQIGNETRNGMLHPTGQLWDDDGNIAGGWSNFAALVNSGYDAAKSVFSDAIVLVHLDNAYADNVWWFDDFKEAGGKFDMIGLSHYPMSNTDEYTWKVMNTKALTNIKNWASSYGVKVMVCEVGVYPGEDDAETCLSQFISSAAKLDGCAGVFYWEPEVYGYWKPGTYENVWGWNSYDMAVFDSDGSPSSIMNAFAH